MTGWEGYDVVLFERNLVFGLKVHSHLRRDKDQSCTPP